jgi:hypothetical protein
MVHESIVDSLLDPGTAAKIFEAVSPTVVRDLFRIVDPE